MPEFPGRLRTPRLAAAPSSPVRGELYYNTVDEKLYWYNGTAWIDATGGGGGGGAKTFRTSHTWAVAGAVAAGSLPRIFVGVASGQTIKVVQMIAYLNSGTSVQVYLGDIFGNDIVTPAQTVAAGVVKTVNPTPYTLADGNGISPSVLNPTGNPVDLSITAVLEYTV